MVMPMVFTVALAAVVLSVVEAEKSFRVYLIFMTHHPRKEYCAKLTGNGSRNWISEEVSEVNWTEIK